MGKYVTVWVSVVLLLACGSVADATPCYGNDSGALYEISPTDPGGWTSHASINAAVTAGSGLGRTTMEFQGAWTGVNETVTLHNGLTYQGGAANTSMSWNATYTSPAFEATVNADWASTIQRLDITAAGRGVQWTTDGAPNPGGGDYWDGQLTLKDSSINSGTTAIWLGDTSGNKYDVKDTGVKLEVSNSLIQAADGIFVRAKGSGRAITTLSNSRLEVSGVGIRTDRIAAGGNDGLTVIASEIICTDETPDTGDKGIDHQGNTPGRPLVVVGSLVKGFTRGIANEYPATTDGLSNAVLLANNTVVGTGSSTGIFLQLGVGQTNNYDKLTAKLANNILAGHDVGLRLNSAGDSGSSLLAYGDNNAFFENSTDVQKTNSSFSDAGRLDDSGALAGYTLANTFCDPGDNDYVLLAEVLGGGNLLLDVGKQYQTTVLGSGTQTWVDLNRNGSYQDGTDVVIDLGGGTPNAGTRVMLYDAEYGDMAPRLLDGVVDIGAYEGGDAGGPVPEPAGLTLVGLALLTVRRRRS